MKKLSIAMVAACPFPANRGTPSRIKGLAEALAERGHRVAIVTYHFGLDMPTTGIEIHRISNFPYRRLDPGPTWCKLGLLDPCLFVKLMTLLRAEHFDLIHAHQFEGALIGYGARRFTGHPVVYDAHTTLAAELSTYSFPNPRGVAGYLDQKVPDLADHVIAVSGTLRDSLVGMEIPERKIDVVPTGMRIGDFAHGHTAAIRDEYHLAGRRVVMYTGSLAEFQRVDLLIDAMAKVVREDPDAVLILVVASDRPEIRARCEELGITQNVVVAVEPTFDRVPEFLAAADVVVVPRPLCPGIPQKLVNYMAAGKPVVSFEGSAKLLEHRINGLVVPNGNVDAMADSILELLRDPTLGKRLGDQARASVAEHYDWSKLVDRLERIYTRVLEQPNGRPKS